VPGWFSTYWVKMLSDVEVLTGEDDNFWMAKAYRMPTVPVKPGDKDFPTVPITTMGPRSFITSHADGVKVASAEIRLRGIAFGGDCGVAKVTLISRPLTGPSSFTPVGDVEHEVMLGPEEGVYGFRRWEAVIKPSGFEFAVAALCENTKRVRQTRTGDWWAPAPSPNWNPSGYARNAIERITLRTR
jgi:hypothetical protein